MNKHKILYGGQKRTLLGGPKERKARKACQKAMMAFRRVVFALTSQTKHNKGRGKHHRGKDREGTYPQSGFSPSGTPNEEGYGHAWESDDWSGSHRTDNSWTSDTAWFCTMAHTGWMVAAPLNLANHPTHVVLDLGCTRSIGSRTAIEILYCYWAGSRRRQNYMSSLWSVFLSS